MLHLSLEPGKLCHAANLMKPHPKHIRTWGVLTCTAIVFVASWIWNQSLFASLAETFGLVFFWCLFYDEEE